MNIGYHMHLCTRSEKKELQIQPYVELIYVLEGSGTAVVDEKEIPLCTNEFFMINFGSQYKIETTCATALAILDIDYSDLIRETKQSRWRFDCDTASEKTKSHYDLRRSFAVLLREYILKERTFEELSAFYALLNTLTSEYGSREAYVQSTRESSKFDQVLLYIQAHYQEKISREDLCNRFFYSAATLTRVFKKMTGMSLVEYLNKIRIQAVAEQLLNTDHHVTQIALSCGFSDAAALNKVFKKEKGIPPVQFKTQNKNEVNHFAKKSEQLFLKEVSQRYLDRNQVLLKKMNHSVSELIELDMAETKPYQRIWSRVISVAKAIDLTDAHYQQKLLEKRGGLYYEYIRVNEVFSSEMEIRKKAGTIKLDFSRIDIVLDFLIANQIKPMLEISGLRQKIVSRHTVLLYATNETSFFKDKKDYLYVIKQFFKHITSRYTIGDPVIESWIWELNYDSALLTWEEYKEVFQEVAAILHKWNCKIGGYGIELADCERGRILEFLTERIAPDFFSVRAYPYELNAKSQNTTYYERSCDERFIAKHLAQIKEAIAESERKTELWVTQWNTSLLDANLVNDSFAKAARLAHVIVQMEGIVDLAIFDCVIDSKNHEKRGNALFYGGRGLISNEGIDKPAYLSFHHIAFMEKELLQKGRHHIFSKKGRNRLIGMCFNVKNYNVSYFQTPEDDITISGLDHIYENQDTLEQEFRIRGLADGTYRIKLFKTTKESGALNKSIEMFKQSMMDLNDLWIMRNTLRLEVETMELGAFDNTLSFKLSILPNETATVEIYPVELD